LAVQLSVTAANSPSAPGILFDYAFPFRPCSELLGQPLRALRAGVYRCMWSHFTAQGRGQQSAYVSHAHGFTHALRQSNANSHAYPDSYRHGGSGSVTIPVYGRSLSRRDPGFQDQQRWRALSRAGITVRGAKFTDAAGCQRQGPVRCRRGRFDGIRRESRNGNYQ